MRSSFRPLKTGRFDQTNFSTCYFEHSRRQNLPDMTSRLSQSMERNRYVSENLIKQSIAKMELWYMYLSQQVPLTPSGTIDLDRLNKNRILTAALLQSAQSIVLCQML